MEIFDKFFKACDRGNIDEVINLFEKVKNPEVKMQLIDSEHSTGFTPLVTACYSAHYEVVEFLIKQGANIDKPDVANINSIQQNVYSSLTDAARHTIKESNINKPDVANINSIQQNVYSGLTDNAKIKYSTYIKYLRLALFSTFFSRKQSHFSNSLKYLIIPTIHNIAIT
jgi:ankyrin repeat protein